MTKPGKEKSAHFEHRGMSLDLRAQVMSLESILEFIEEMRSFKMNVLLIEWEATFPFSKHSTICNQSAYTPKEVTSILSACKAAGIEVIPIQQCFGHVEYILMHLRYAGLRENDRNFSQVCPLKADESIEVFEEIFEELFEFHDSPYIHIGGDETRLLGTCEECASVVESEGKAKLYTDYLLRLIEMVKRLGKRPIIWADILLTHPDLIDQLPRDLILIDWNYGWDVKKFGDTKDLINLGFEVWGATAMRSAPDNHSKTCWMRHFNNLKDFIPFARETGYSGMIQTSWSTSGEYGYLMDSEGVASKILPIRRVYPQAGFRILIQAFADSVDSAEALAPQPFVERYGAERFGLNQSDSRSLARLLGETGDQENAAVATPEQADEWMDALRQISPESHQGEFAHIALIVRMSIQGIKVSRVYEQFQLLATDLKRINAISGTVGRLLQEAQIIDKDFRRLNQHSLSGHELDEEKSYREVLLLELSNRIEHLKERFSQ